MTPQRTCVRINARPPDSCPFATDAPEGHHARRMRTPAAAQRSNLLPAHTQHAFSKRPHGSAPQHEHPLYSDGHAAGALSALGAAAPPPRSAHLGGGGGEGKRQYLSALASLKAAPSSAQQAHAETVREQLKRDLEAQVRWRWSVAVFAADWIRLLVFASGRTPHAGCPEMRQRGWHCACRSQRSGARTRSGSARSVRKI